MGVEEKAVVEKLLGWVVFRLGVRVWNMQSPLLER